MVSLAIKDYVFSKKILIITILYCLALPLVLIVDQDAKWYFLDLLIPFAIVSAPISKLAQMEDSKSGLIFRKTIMLSKYEVVGSRFVFATSLVVLSGVVLAIVKTVELRALGIIDSLESLPFIMAGFAIYNGIYLAVYYWKGFFATQFCTYGMIVVLIFGRKLLQGEALESFQTIISNRILMGVGSFVVVLLLYFLCVFFEGERSLDK